MIFGDNCINYYTFKGDTLLQVGKESPLEIISYSIPLNNMKYPIVYGDSLYPKIRKQSQWQSQLQ